MVLQVFEVSHESEFEEIWPLHLLAFAKKYQALSKFLNPTHAYKPEMMETSKAAFVKMWKRNPKRCHWIQVMETNNYKTVGAACWIFNLGKPVENVDEPQFDVYWHAEGSEERLFTEKLLAGVHEVSYREIRAEHLGKSTVLPFENENSS